jgi:hypothetical protein
MRVRHYAKRMTGAALKTRWRGENGKVVSGKEPGVSLALPHLGSTRRPPDELCYPISILRQVANAQVGEKKRAVGHPNTTTDNTGSHWEGYGMLVVTDQQGPGTVGASSRPMALPRHDVSSISTYRAVMQAAYSRVPSQKQKLVSPIVPYSTFDTPGRAPHQIMFPLSTDHCLITLVQYNVVRAMMFNLAVLSLQNHLPPGCRDSLGIPTLDVTPTHEIPPDLQPTPLQESTTHPFWISAIPFPAMRENLILMAGTYDSDDLLTDLGMGVYNGFDDVERRGFLVWEQPWRKFGWEVSEGFVKKWGFLLKGCTDVVESTNRWRQTRGEEDLVVEMKATEC